MGALRTFTSSAYFAYFALFNWLSPPMWLTAKFVLPLGQMAFFTILGSYVAANSNPPLAAAQAAHLVAYIALGNALQALSWSTVFSLSNTTGTEKWEGSLSYLLATPANRLSLFIGRSVLYILDGLVPVTISLVYAVFLFGVNVPPASLPLIVIAAIITSFGMSGFGLMLAGLALYLRNSIVIANIFTFIVLLFCGVNFPVSTLGYLQPISYAIPLTYGENVIHGVGDVTFNLIYGLVSGLILTLIGYGIFRYFEGAARRKGFLDIA